jgi:hypothetical protein
VSEYDRSLIVNLNPSSGSREVVTNPRPDL